VSSCEQAARPEPQAPTLEKAREVTAQVRDQLEVAGAELHLTNSQMLRGLPQARGEVRKALDQYAAVEEKVVGAAEELTGVTELLEEEMAERRRLELELERLSSTS
jgi:hypothetical protein